LCALPVIASALPVDVPRFTATQLRARILSSASESYAGYAESNAAFGLPSLSGLESVTALLDGVTKMRVWQATPDRWRVDVLSDAGEDDTYQNGNIEYLWNSDAQLLSLVLPGRSPVFPAGLFSPSSIRLPRAADLVPPALALRLLRLAGAGARYSIIPPVRVAGQSAAGLRVIPADPASTVGSIDIWAQPSTGLPLMVEVFGRGSASPALLTQFFAVGQWHPAASVLTPARGPGTGFTVTNAGNLSGALNNLTPESVPGTLAGRKRVPTAGFNTIGLYGGGLATFTVLNIGGSSGFNLMQGAQAAGGHTYNLSNGTAVLISASLLNAVIAQPDHSGATFLIAGTVNARLLLAAAITLTGSAT
jgi:hypothetical protein